MIDYKVKLESYGYKLVCRDKFCKATDVPAGLLVRADKIAGLWVVYDPDDDDEGFMLIGNDQHALAKEAWDFLDAVGTIPDA